jgi:hypothetical protein
MPGKKTIERAQNDKRAGKAPSTQAGEFVREEMEHVREGKHGARNTKQAIAIGLSKARKAGVNLPPPPGGAAPKSRGGKTNPKRSRATLNGLKREGRQAASHEAISHQAKAGARQRGPAARQRAAKKAARTRAAGAHEPQAPFNAA